jgi:hypothetical protein
VPFEQRLEQHWAPEVHWLPSVWHVLFSAAHVPLTQLWLQQFPFEVQAPWSDVHAGYLHAPPVQSPLQQSPAAAQPAPRPKQLPAAPPPPPFPKTVGVSDASTALGGAPSSPNPDATSAPAVASAERPPSRPAVFSLLPHPRAYAETAATAIQASTIREPIVNPSDASRCVNFVDCGPSSNRRLRARAARRSGGARTSGARGARDAVAAIAVLGARLPIEGAGWRRRARGRRPGRWRHGPADTARRALGHDAR